MSSPKEAPDKRRTGLTLILLVLVDFLSFVTLGSEDGHLTFGLAPSKMALVQVVVDVALAYGLLKSLRWALEFVRYRCILGIGYILFIWLLYAMTMDATDTFRLEGILLAAVVRDAVIAFWLAGALFLIRPQTKVQLPKAPAK